jgi:glutamate-1-semialdehyde aminotransferase
VTIAAVRVAFDLLTRSGIERIDALGERLAGGLRRVFAGREGLAVVVLNCGSMVHANYPSAHREPA